MKMGKIYIYGTVFNNASRINDCLESIKPLEPEHIFIVDNYSNDLTYEILSNTKNVTVIQKHCNRGLGRDMALEMLRSAHPNDDDLTLYIDMDVIYKKKWIDLVKGLQDSIKDNQIHIFSGIANAKTQLSFDWKNLMMGEDWERLARMKKSGVEIIGIKDAQELIDRGAIDRKVMWDNEWNMNDVSTDFQADRERRYAKNKLQLMMRWYITLVDGARGIGYHSLSDFYSTYKRLRGDSLFARTVFTIAYMIATIKGIYRYDDKLSNDSYVMGHDLLH